MFIYRSEFYGYTWRYVGHPRLADDDQWVADALATRIDVINLQDELDKKIQSRQVGEEIAAVSTKKLSTSS